LHDGRRLQKNVMGMGGNPDMFNISLADAMGYIAAVLVFITFWMKTMVPLRLLGIMSNVFFIAYGYLALAYPPLFLHILLLPLNLYRLREMMRLTGQVEKAAGGDLDMAWLKPFASSRAMNRDDVLFDKGEQADRLYFIVSGSLQLLESGIEIGPGNVVGELAMLSPTKTRTQSLKCRQAGELLEITYSQVKQLYFQNPKFGFYFLELTTKRLFQNIARLEDELGRLRSRLAAASGQPDQGLLA
jgi:CRP/FNR family cyclic AMP-dependent transcriptional regulator